MTAKDLRRKILAEAWDLPKPIDKGYWDGVDDVLDILDKHIKIIEKIGREETWDAARKIALSERYGGYSCNELNVIFGTAKVSNIMENDAERVLYLIRLHEAKMESEETL